MAINRRYFLKNGPLAGLALPSLLQASQPALPFAKSRANQPDEFELNECTIDWLQQKMQNGQYTSVGLVGLYLDRIARIDKTGPAIHAIIELNPDAPAIAAVLDNERKQGKLRGPLHGVPVLVKDNIDTGDRMMTTAGSLALVGNRASTDAFIIKKLRLAGAVILGKTNLSEFANFRSEHSTSGWSGRGGQTRMPYILDRNPSGSSSGSGAAVSSNCCAIAIGTETDGSIVSPASVNGLVGIKPTVGLWSRTGIIPISKTQDSAGPMARTVKDAAILLGALAGLDPADEATSQNVGKYSPDYTRFLDPHGLKGKRLGIEQSFLSGQEGVVACYKKALETLKACGAELVEIELLKALDDKNHAEFKVLQYEFKEGIDRYLSRSSAPVKTLRGVIAFNNAHPSSSMPYFKQETLESSDAKGGLDEKEYQDALDQSFHGARKIIDDFLLQNKLDAVAGVTNGLACCIDLANGDYDTGFSFSTPPARAGYPHITVPMGLVDELPIGISFFAGAYSEPALIAMAFAFEQATQARRAPKFLSPLDLY